MFDDDFLLPFLFYYLLLISASFFCRTWGSFNCWIVHYPHEYWRTSGTANRTILLMNSDQATFLGVPGSAFSLSHLQSARNEPENQKRMLY